MCMQTEWTYSRSDEDLAGCAAAFIGVQCASTAVKLLTRLEKEYGMPTQLPNESVRLKMRRDESWVYHCFSCGMHNYIAWIEVRC